MTTAEEIEILLRDDGWLRRIARALLRAPDDVEDVVQDAHVAALEAGDRARDGRAWLSGVVRHSALGVRRRAAREGGQGGGSRSGPRSGSRSGAEQLAPATDEVAGDLELRRRVASLVLELPEPQRTAVHMAYIAEASMTEVAGRLCVAPSTATYHVQRGVEALRRRLDADGGGARRSWAMGLAALGGEGAVEPASGWGWAAWAVGGLGAAAAVALAVLALGRPGSDPLAAPLGAVSSAGSSAGPSAGTSAGSGPAAATPALAAVAAPLIRAPGARMSASEDPAPLAGLPATLRARFLMPDGAPAAGLRWTLAVGSDGISRVMEESTFGIPGPFAPLSGVLDGEGAVEVELEGHRARPLELHLDTGRFGRVSRGFRAGPGETLELGTTVLEDAPTLVGRIVDAEGAPVIGMSFETLILFASEVSAGRRIAAFGVEDAAAGTFLIRAPREGAFTLRVESVASQTLATEQVTIERDEPTEITVTVDPAKLRHSIVRWRVDRRRTAMPRDVGPVAVADEAGEPVEPLAITRHSVWLPDPGEGALTVRLTDPALAPVLVEGIRAGEERWVDLLGSSAVRLEVEDADGDPLTRFTVLRGAGAWASQAVLLHDGRVPLPGGVLDRLLPGDHSLTLEVDGARGAVTVEDLAPGEVRDVRVRLEALARVTGVARWSDGTPMAGIRVGLCLPAVGGRPGAAPMVKPLGFVGHIHGPPVREEVAAGLTGEDGSFCLSVDSVGPHRVYVKPGVGTMAWSERIEVTPGGAASVALEGSAPVRLSGRVALPYGTDPGEWSVIVCDLAEFTRAMRAVAIEELPLDDLGAFQGLVPAGANCEVSLVRRGEGVSILNGVLGGQPLGELALKPGEERRLELDARQGPWASVTVDVTSIEELGADPHIRIATAHEDGQLLLDTTSLPISPTGTAGPFRLPAGRARVWLVGEDWADFQQPELMLEAGDSRIEVVVRTVTKRVRVLAGDEPAAGIRLRPMASTSGAPTAPIFTSDQDGWITLRLAPGRARLGVLGVLGVPGGRGAGRGAGASIDAQWPDVEELRLP